MAEREAIQFVPLFSISHEGQTLEHVPFSPRGRTLHFPRGLSSAVYFHSCPVNYPVMQPYLQRHPQRCRSR